MLYRLLERRRFFFGELFDQLGKKQEQETHGGHHDQRKGDADERIEQRYFQRSGALELMAGFWLK